jgi:hypothetical protein
MAPCDTDNHMFVNGDGRLPVVVKEVPVQLPRTSVKTPTGLSFAIPDLLILQGWSDFHDLRMTVELDFCVDSDEYEELLGLYDANRAFRRWMIWRSCDGIVVQPTMGRTMLFDTMADVLEMLIPVRD